MMSNEPRKQKMRKAEFVAVGKIAFMLLNVH